LLQTGFFPDAKLTWRIPIYPPAHSFRCAAMMEDRMSVITTMLRATHFSSKRPLALVTKWLSGRRDRRLLEAMTDGELRDIGIDRGQIDFALRVGGSRRLPAYFEVQHC
jgi:uncharacterized protein YjiS (DUF1127 family)